MDFQTYCKEAENWAKETTKSQLELLDNIENESKLIFVAGNVSFYVVCPTQMKADWNVGSDTDFVLPYINKLQQLFKSSPPTTLTSLLEIVEETLLELLQENEDFEADDDDDDDDNDGYEYEIEEELRTPSPAVTQSHHASGGGSPLAVNRLLKDLTALRSSQGKFGFTAQPRDDNLFLWDVQLIDFEDNTPLGHDLHVYAKRYHREPVIHMEMQFSDDYPMSPPFVRILRPKFKFLTGHVTIGGSICMELLTRSGWKPTNDIEGIIVQIRAEIMSDPNARLDKHPDKEYEESAAKHAFKRMENTYGWNK